jgi:hypothetical protein
MSTYDINGNKLASVTTIISDCTDKSGALTQWAANQAVEWIRQNTDGTWTEEDLDNARFNFRDISKEALGIGSEVHDAVEHYLKTGKERKLEIPESISAFVAFLEWQDSVHLEVIETEKTVNGKYYAGTLDLLAMVNGVRTIVDIKTSKAIYPDYRYQIAAYRATQNNVDGSGILRLDKETGLPEYKDFSKTHEADLQVFKAMVELYYLRHPRNAKKAGYENLPA